MANFSYGRQQLEDARTRLLFMAASVEGMIRDVVSAFHDRDAARAMEIIDRDEAIDEMDNQLDEICLRILALENPVAADLRMVVAIMRATSNLERIADEASNITDISHSTAEMAEDIKAIYRDTKSTSESMQRLFSDVQKFSI